MVSEKKRQMKSKLWWGILFILIASYFIKLPYYYTQPGEALELAPYVHVEGGYQEEKGEIMLTTISLARANPYLFIWAQFSPYRELIPIKNVRREEESDEEYFKRQEIVMQYSQDNAAIVAYKKAGKQPEIIYNGILVFSLIKGMPAAEKLQSEDRIIAIDGHEIINANQLNAYTANKKEGDEIQLTVERQGEIFEVTLPLKRFPKKMAGSEDRVGLGILYPTVDRVVVLDPKANIDVEKIGGPSAGLMFSLEIYNQLVPEDITKGYKIAGTGEIDEEGNVKRIGGVHQKVIAAYEKGAEIFFAPKEGNREDSNYHVAKKTVEELGIPMEVVGVETFDGAIEFLQQLEEK